MRAMDILRLYCDQAGVSYNTIDEGTELVVHIERCGKHLVVSYKDTYPLNPYSSSRIVRDKNWAALHLQQQGYKTPKGQLFFTVAQHKNYPTKGQDITAACAYAQQLGFPVFVKPNQGSKGNLAKKVNNARELATHFEAIAKVDYGALLQEPIGLPEYRIFVLGDRVEFTYQKSRPELVGDGHSTLKKLLKKYNLHTKNTIVENNPFLLEQFRQNSLSMATVLPQNERLTIAPNANLNTGGQLIDYNEMNRPALNRWAAQLIKCFGLQIAGIDVFGHNLENPEDLVVLEINSVPALSSIYRAGQEDKVFNIWGKILEQYFSI